MTITDTTTDDTGIATETVTDEQVATETTVTEQSPAARVVQIDPHDLAVEENIRTNADISRSFVASIRRHGVIVPILAHPGTDGAIHVRDGQRRTLAAREGELATVPVYVVDASDERRVRIVQQIIANEHRAALTNADRASAWQQLALEGMSVSAIARQTGTKREEVRTGLAVASHEVAAQAVAKYDLTLDQALVLAEFEDSPEMLADLTDIAKRDPESFDHHAQRALDAKATAQEIAALRAEHEAQGHTVVDWPGWDHPTIAFLRELRTADGERLTEETYTGQPGHAIAVGERWGRVAVEHVVIDWATHGLHKISAGGTRRGRMTPEEKAERRTLIANNKAWNSAEKVRRAWLGKFLGRKRLPKNAVAYAARVLATDGDRIAKAATSGHKMAHALLGLEPGYRSTPLATLATENPTRAGHVILAIALAAQEEATGKHTWRSPGDSDAAYFRQLAAWGYHLADVEHIVTGEPEDQQDQDTGAESIETETDPTDDRPQHQEDPAQDADAGRDEGTVQDHGTDPHEGTDPDGATEPEADARQDDDAEPESAEPDEDQDEETQDEDDDADAVDAGGDQDAQQDAQQDAA